jgi:hypothetical protein
MPIDSHLPQADPFSLVTTFKVQKSLVKNIDLQKGVVVKKKILYCSFGIE